MSKNELNEFNMLKAIKKMESQKRIAESQAIPEVELPVKISFDEWWIMRAGQIPRQHKKEIVKADFMGRKLSDKEEVNVFDAALVKYGIIL